jgi:F0F1-type ATP synthase membrane subunit b/b'
MENLQIKASDVYKLLVFCVACAAYYFSLKNSFNIINERQKVIKIRIDFIEDDVEELKKSHIILKTQHDEKHCEKK